MYTKSFKHFFLPILPKAAIRYECTEDGKKIAEHDEGMVDDSSAVVAETKLSPQVQ